MSRKVKLPKNKWLMCILIIIFMVGSLLMGYYFGLALIWLVTSF